MDTIPLPSAPLTPIPANPGRPVARDVGDRLQTLILRTADTMISDGYDVEMIEALAALVAAAAAHNQLGLAIRSFVSDKQAAA